MAYTVVVRFVWDDAKDLANRLKHRVSFEEASELFSSGAEYLEVFDDEHSFDEDRLIAIGPIRRGVVLVVWTERDEETIRIIGARWATKKEKALYRFHILGQP